MLSEDKMDGFLKKVLYTEIPTQDNGIPTQDTGTPTQVTGTPTHPRCSDFSSKRMKSVNISALFLISTSVDVILPTHKY